jgi:hypothetical protein
LIIEKIVLITKYTRKLQFFNVCLIHNEEHYDR